jgi:hypothetical protein
LGNICICKCISINESDESSITYFSNSSSRSSAVSSGRSSARSSMLSATNPLDVNLLENEDALISNSVSKRAIEHYEQSSMSNYFSKIQMPILYKVEVQQGKTCAINFKFIESFNNILNISINVLPTGVLNVIGLANINQYKVTQLNSDHLTHCNHFILNISGTLNLIGIIVNSEDFYRDFNKNTTDYLVYHYPPTILHSESGSSINYYNTDDTSSL